MNATDFFSGNTYLFLPTSKNPKVALSIDNRNTARNAFKLYNPFSRKAKFLKFISKLFINGFGSSSKRFFIKNKKQKGNLVIYLEKELDLKLTSSVYFATAKDKVVLQLQSNDKIIGYLKYPINEIGIKRIKNEKKAIDILSGTIKIAPVILFKQFEDKPLLLLDELKGNIKKSKRKEIVLFLEKFKKKEKFPLDVHPAILNLLTRLNTKGLKKEINILKSAIKNSDLEYFEVYEHGDFAPWNLIEKDGKLTAFDFEYFEEKGLEYMDLIKYYYQIGSLLKKMTEKDLIHFLSNQIRAFEIKVLLKIFLIKEIERKYETKESVVYEKNMLDFLLNEKA